MSRQILLIDDDHEEQDIFKEAVNAAKISFNCVCASTGKEGIKLIEKLLPDYIFLDINMPGMNGLECLQEIKKREPIKQIPVIIYSTAVDKIISYTAVALGAANCIKKVSSVSELAETLKSILISDVNTLY
jgi:CheY-like chemotaxis protein